MYCCQKSSRGGTFSTTSGSAPSGGTRRHGVDVRLGDAVVGIDRARRAGASAAGRGCRTTCWCSRLAASRTSPAIEGLRRDDDTLIPGAFFLRTVDDCREMIAASRSAHRVAVIGGGLLGIEAAHALAVHDTEVIVLHSSEHVLDRQLDDAAGDVLGRALHGLSIAVRLGARAQRVIIDDAGQLGGVEFADGSYVLADLLVIAAGTTPRVDLARACGLQVDRGIVIDDTHAIGRRSASLRDRRLCAVRRPGLRRRGRRLGARRDGGQSHHRRGPSCALHRIAIDHPAEGRGL